MRFKSCVLPGLSMLVPAMALWGGTIGQWEGSAVDPSLGIPVTWHHPSFSKVLNLVTGAGHTVGPDAPATAPYLAQYDAFLMRGAARPFTAQESADLRLWVQGGGLLLMFADSDTPTTYMNPNLTALGSSLSFGGYVSQNFYFLGGLFATTTPYNVAGYWMNGTPGTGVHGGNQLSTGGPGWPDWAVEDAILYVHWEQIGQGYIIGFADSLDHNYFILDPGTPRGNFFLNLTAYENPFGGPGPGPGDVPEPSTIWLAVAGLLLMGAARRR